VVFGCILLQWWNHDLCRSSCRLLRYPCFWHQSCQCLWGISRRKLWRNRPSRLHNNHRIVIGQANSGFRHWCSKPWCSHPWRSRFSFSSFWHRYYWYNYQTIRVNRFRWNCLCWWLRPNRNHHNYHQHCTSCKSYRWHWVRRRSCQKKVCLQTKHPNHSWRGDRLPKHHRPKDRARGQTWSNYYQD